MDQSTNSKRRVINRLPILVVEDNADNWLIMRSALAQCFPEAKPSWMNHSAQTLAFLNSPAVDGAALPQLILLDLYLPRREDGLALIETIKAHPLYRQIPLIVMSHSREPEDISKVYAYSIASYIVKPITYHQWLNCFYTFQRYWQQVVRLPLPTP